MINNSIKAIVLAAGNSSRFNSGRTKVVEPICGQPMLLYVLNTLRNLKIDPVLVVGVHEEEIKAKVKNIDNIKYINQKKQLGTGDAVLCTQPTWDKDHVLILNGDVPLLTEEIIEKLCKKHIESSAVVSFITSDVLDPKGYGRVIEKDEKVYIVEEKDCTENEKQVSVINAGVYIVRKDFLVNNIKKIKKSSVSGEYYVTELVNMASRKDEKVQSVFVPYDYVRGVNTLEELWIVEHIKRSELIKSWMLQGVRFYSPLSVQIDYGVKIGAGTCIGAGVHLLANASIGENCTIGSYSIIKNTIIKNCSTIYAHSVIHDSSIGSSCEVGPFARLRNSAIIQNNAVVGNFVEIKNSVIGPSSKAKHLSYIGDATLGKNVNIGAGTITCNHDGANKHKTEISDGAYVGSNNTLIAPIKIGKGAYTAAGSTLNKDVSENDLAIARSKQENKKGYAEKIRRKTKLKKLKTINSSETIMPNKKLSMSFFGAVKTDDLSKDTV